MHFQIQGMVVKLTNTNRVPTPSASTRTRRMPRLQLRNLTIRTLMASASPSSSARRVANMIPALIDVLPAEMTIVAAIALLAEMMVLPRHATTAASPATSPESAVSLAASADLEADPTSNTIFIFISISNTTL